MSPASNDRLDGCPVCDADAVRPLTPLSPEVEAYRCDNCNHRWSEN